VVLGRKDNLDDVERGWQLWLRGWQMGGRQLARPAVGGG